MFKVRESRKPGKKEILAAQMKARELQQERLEAEFMARKKLIAKKIFAQALPKKKHSAFMRGWNLRNQTLADTIEKLDGVTPELKRRLVLLILRG